MGQNKDTYSRPVESSMFSYVLVRSRTLEFLIELGIINMNQYLHLIGGLTAPNEVKGCRPRHDDWEDRLFKK